MAFRIGSTRDPLTAAGAPCFNEAAFDELARDRDVAWERIPEVVAEITPEIAARHDGLHVDLPRVTAASVDRDDRRVRVIARNGVGFDGVDVAACAAKGIVVANAPPAIRRPVAAAAPTLVFALAGRLFAKDRLVRAGRWNARVERMGIGLTGRTPRPIGAGGIGRAPIPLAPAIRLPARAPRASCGARGRVPPTGG